MAIPKTDPVDFDLNAFRRGDRQALTYVYNQTNRLVFFIAFSILKDIPTTEDVVSETYLNLIVGDKEKFTSYTFIRRFLCVVARNKALNIIKSKAHQQLLPSDLETLIKLAKIQEPSPLEDLIADTIEKERLPALLANLPPHLRETIDAYYFKKITIGEIAKRVKKTDSTISRWLEQARQTLRKQLIKNDDRILLLLFWLGHLLS